MDYQLSQKQQLDLRRLLDENPEATDNTEYIRQARQAMKIERDARVLQQLVDELSEVDDPDERQRRCQEAAPFMYEHQRWIFNKCLKKEINYDTLHDLVTILLKIENGYYDQHTGSVIAGEILAKLYISSDILHGENLDKEHPTEAKNNGIPLSWAAYKASTNT
jgi:hypothetical protein